MGQIANYPAGFSDGVSIRGVPLAQTHTGKVFWVGNNTAQYPNQKTASNGNDGSFLAPFSTLAYAISRCTANRGDTIFIKSGHAETIATATALDLNIAGINVVGLGAGATRPRYTVNGVNTATITVSAANVSLQGIVVVTGLDGVDTAVTITGASAYVDIEHQDTSSTVEADIAVTATGDKLTLKLKDIGFIAGDQREASVSLNGVDNARIDIDYYGILATAVVNFVGTSCTDIRIKGYMYVSGQTGGAKNVVDTIGSSLWFATIEDGAAGASFSGGSAAALAADDVSAVAALLVAPVADVTTTTNMRDSVGIKTDAGVTAVGTTKSLMAYLKGLVTMNTVQTADATNNAFAGDVVGNKTDAAVTTVGTTKSVLAYVKGVLNQIGTLANTGGTATVGGILGDFANTSLSDRTVRRTAFAKADVTAVTAWTTGNSPVTVATVTGTVLCRVFAVVTNAFTSTATNGTLALGVSDNVALWIAATTADGTNFATGDVWVGPTTTTKGNLLNNTSGWALVSSDTIKVTIATNSMTAGGMTIYVEWMPITAGATVA